MLRKGETTEASSECRKMGIIKGILYALAPLFCSVDLYSDTRDGAVEYMKKECETDFN